MAGADPAPASMGDRQNSEDSHRLLYQPAKSLGRHQPGQLISLHLHLAIGCLPTYDCIVSGWRENLRESLSQTGTAVIFHPARRIVIVPFLGEV